MNKSVLLTIGIGIGVILLFIFGANMVKNGAYQWEENVKTAHSETNVYEKRRQDLIPNLVECVKSYSQYEYKVLQDVIKARNLNNDADVKEIERQISVVAEAYPDLKANEQYKTLMLELATTENLIAQYRNNYNEQVREYNKFVRTFPNAQLLGLTGYEKQNYKYLNYDEPEDAPKVDLSIDWGTN